LPFWNQSAEYRSAAAEEVKGDLLVLLVSLVAADDDDWPLFALIK